MSTPCQHFFTRLVKYRTQIRAGAHVEKIHRLAAQELARRGEGGAERDDGAPPSKKRSPGKSKKPVAVKMTKRQQRRAARRRLLAWLEKKEQTFTEEEKTFLEEWLPQFKKQHKMHPSIDETEKMLISDG